ncbi:MAG: thioredoxin domain-containing protein [Arcicella sp.]|nr:thioredoxin domain-containing protein [Arcicella sp.]
MKSKFLIPLFLMAFMFHNCSDGQTKRQNLSAVDFANKANEIPAAPIIDVRTPDEFSKGHIPKAKNINWNGDDFDKQIATLDKSKPVFVYCLSGGRSSSAANKMRSDGFKEVYELDGGIMKWRGANLPENNENKPVGMNRKAYDDLIKSDKIVLVDFYADWCGPCKLMKPYLEEISKEMADKVVVIRINADDNQALCKELKIDALPVLQVFKNQKLTWSHVGFIDKKGVEKEL